MWLKKVYQGEARLKEDIRIDRQATEKKRKFRLKQIRGGSQ